MNQLLHNGVFFQVFPSGSLVLLPAPSSLSLPHSKLPNMKSITFYVPATVLAISHVYSHFSLSLTITILILQLRKKSVREVKRLAQGQLTSKRHCQNLKQGLQILSSGLCISFTALWQINTHTHIPTHTTQRSCHLPQFYMVLSRKQLA